jgi:ribonuclease P protein component
VMKFGKKIPSRNLILFFKENRSQVHRLGLVVSREVGSAAYRNRIKRFVREFFRHHKNKIRGTLDMVVLVRKNCTLQSYRETKEEVGRLVGIVWERERSGVGYWKKPLSRWFMPTSIPYRFLSGPVVVSLQVAHPMLFCRLNDLEFSAEVSMQSNDW